MLSHQTVLPVQDNAPSLDVLRNWDRASMDVPPLPADNDSMDTEFEEEEEEEEQHEGEEEDDQEESGSRGGGILGWFTTLLWA